MMKKIALFVAFTFAITHFVPVPAYSKSIYPGDITELTEAECQSVVGGTVIWRNDLFHAGIGLIIVGTAIACIGATAGAGFIIVNPEKVSGILFGSPMIIGATTVGGALIGCGILCLTLSLTTDSIHIATPYNITSVNEALLYSDSASLFTETQHLEPSFF